MNATSKSEPLNNIDAAWLHMEERNNLMMVSGIMVIDGTIPRPQMEAILENRLLRHKRFRQKVLDAYQLKAPVWKEDPDFDMKHHVIYERLPEPGDTATLQKRVSELISLQLDFDRPLWQLHVLENYQGEKAALLCRLHHCIADGIALMSVLLSLAGDSPEASVTPLRGLVPQPRLSSSGNLFGPASKALGQAGKTTSRLFQGGIDALMNPSQLIKIAKRSRKGAETLGRLLLRPADPPTVFTGELGIPKRAAWSDAIPLKDVKSVRQVTDSTVNDVLLAAACGALHRYLKHRKTEPKGITIHAAVPVNLRPPERLAELGNFFGLVFPSLPIGIADPLERIFKVKRCMDRIKRSPEAVIALGMLKAVGMTPTDVQRVVVNILGKKTSAVMTNVPGPRTPLYLGGKRIESMMFWVPRSGRVSLGISIISYAGEVRLGVATDTGLVPDPEHIIAGFHQDFEDMMELVHQVKE